jgi:putative tricarboxylic transport membrane protein
VGAFSGIDFYSGFLILIGLLSGIVVGILPGLTATMGVAVLVPFTFVLSPEQGMALILGMYCGAIYAGSVSAILVNIPGTPAAIATNLDGNPLAKQGKAGEALGMATVGSFIGGTFSVIILFFAAPLIASFALKFGPPEYFALAIFGLSIIANIAGSSLAKGLIAGCMGLFLATIGMDPITSYSRYTFDNPNLLTGVELLPVLIGLFGLAEALYQIKEDEETVEILQQKITNIVPKLSVLNRVKRTLLRSSVIGTFIGAVPAAGAPIAAFISYNEAKRVSRNKDNFGKGELEGIAAAETANNATTGGALIPLLTLSVPGDGVTAILLGAFIIHGITPGPTLFSKHPQLVNTIYLSLLIANFGILFFGLLGARYFVKIVNTPKYYLLPTIVILCIIGSYALRNSFFDIGVVIFFGILGYFMRTVDVPPGPIVLGLILGPMAESNFRRSLIQSENNLSIFFTRPISLGFMIVTLIVFLIPVYRKWKERKQVNLTPNEQQV